MTESERIERAWCNVNSLARSSDYCNESDHADIELIESIVKKAIPMKPEPYSTCIKAFKKDTFDCVYTRMYSGFVCPICGYELTNDEKKKHDNYCPDCGQRIDWEEQK